VAGTAYTHVWGINEAGVIVGSYAAPSVSHGFVLRNGKFTSFDVPDSTFTAGFAVNTEGDVTGHYGTPPSGKMRGYLLRNGVFTTFSAGDWGLPNTMTCGFGINAEQSMVGHFADGTGQHGFLLAGSVLGPPAFLLLAPSANRLFPPPSSGVSSVQMYRSRLRGGETQRRRLQNATPKIDLFPGSAGGTDSGCVRSTGGRRLFELRQQRD
jgi:hypothetical protein